MIVNYSGISVRTHELFLLVFVTRYLDLFTTYYSLYNSFMKILYIFTTGAIIYMIRFQEPIRSTYDKAQDTFLHWRFAVLPCFLIAIVTHLLSHKHNLSIMELLWTFSIYLEAIAILPQLIVLQRYREVENLTGTTYFSWAPTEHYTLQIGFIELITNHSTSIILWSTSVEFCKHFYTLTFSIIILKGQSSTISHSFLFIL